MSNLRALWQRIHKERLSTAKPPIKEAGVSLMTAIGAQLDAMGALLQRRRKVGQSDRSYRAQLMNALEDKLVAIKHAWEPDDTLLAIVLNECGWMLALERYVSVVTYLDGTYDKTVENDLQFYTRIVNTMNEWFMDWDGHPSAVL